MKQLKRLKGFLPIILIIIAVYFVLGGFMFWYYQSSDLSKAAAGQFGDMFGGITALFGSLTFAGVLYTIILQRKELKLSRRELKLSRIAFEEQNNTTKIQRFENTFFKMIDSFVNARENIFIYSPTGESRNGDEAIRLLLRKIQLELKNCGEFNKENFNEFTRSFDKFYVQETKLKVYYTQVLNLVQLIESTDLNYTQKGFYLKVLRSNIISEYELILLYYYFSIHESISEITRTFLVQQHFFDGLFATYLADPSHLGLIVREKWVPKN